MKDANLCRSTGTRLLVRPTHRRSVPVTTMSVSWLPQTEPTRRFDQSGMVVSGPYQLAISAGAGSTMAAIPAPGKAMWLPEGEAPHNQANMGLDAKRPDSGLPPRSSRRIPECHRRAGIRFHGRRLSFCWCKKEGTQLAFAVYSANFPERKEWHQRDSKDNNDEEERSRTSVTDVRETFTYRLALEFAKNHFLYYIEYQ